MSHDLLESIRRSIAELASIVELESDATASLADRLAAAHVKDARTTWWWTSLATESVDIDYNDGRDGLALVKMLTANCKTLCLFVSDDSHPPWPCFTGSAQDIIDLIADQVFFEFVLTDPQADFAIFDTHHNQLLVTGILVASAREIVQQSP